MKGFLILQVLRDISLKAKSCVYRHEVLRTMRVSIPPLPRDVGWLLAALGLGFGNRMYFLARPMDYDEAYTFLNFVYQGFSDLFYYPLPNNHVLHTLLVRLTAKIWGTGPVAIRLPAFIAGMTSIVLVYFCCRVLFKPRSSGILAAFGLAAFPYMMLYSTNARGYTLLVSFTLGMVLLGKRLITKYSLFNCFLIALTAALGMLTIPTMLFPITGILMWMACELKFVKRYAFSEILRQFMIPCALMTLALTLLFYTPVIIRNRGITSLVSNRFVQPLPLEEFFSQVWPHAIEVAGDLSKGIPSPAILVSLALLLYGVVMATRQHSLSSLLLLPMLILGSLLVLLAQHSIPFARTWIYFIPIFLIYVDMGFAYLLDNISQKYRSLSHILVSVLLCLFSVSYVVKNYQVFINSEVPFIARYLKSQVQPSDIVYISWRIEPQLSYYLWYLPVSNRSNLNRATPREFFVILNSKHTLEELTEGPVTKLLNYGDVTVYYRDVPINLKKELIDQRATTVVRVLGYTLHPCTSQSCNAELRLYFEALDRMERDYVIFLHGMVEDVSLLPPERQQYGFANWDHRPQVPTSKWQPGRIYVDVYRIQTKPGEYRLRFGFWEPRTQERLIVQGSGAPTIELGQHFLR